MLISTGAETVRQTGRIEIVDPSYFRTDIAGSN